MNVFLRILLSFITPLYAHTDIRVFDSSPIEIQWQNYGVNYEYMVEVYDDTNNEVIIRSDWITGNSTLVNINAEGLYLWELYIKEVDKDCNDEHQCLKIESGYFYLDLKDPADININNIDEEEEENVEQKVDHKEEKTEEIVLGASTKETDTQEVEDEEEENITKEKEDVILEEHSCLYKYNIKKKDFYLEQCNISKPKINSSKYNKYDDQYIVSTSGIYESLLNIKVDTVTCKNFDPLDTQTWFNCEEVFIRSDNYKGIKINYEAFFLTSEIIPPYNYIFDDNSFEIIGETKSLPKKVLIKGYFSLKHNNNWLDQQMHITLPVKFEEEKVLNRGKYSFPFNKIVNVNQWHGCTDYQCPHKGIDFAAVKDKIYASDNGVVVSKGYDTYSGKCNSGGNYLVIKYDSGHHMGYLHLEKNYVDVNQKVKKGDLIALSGNSGSHNCQPLGYHLHFELREERSQNTHIDPVPFIDIDWNLVKTNSSNIYPKRLSGDNPHPNF